MNFETGTTTLKEAVIPPFRLKTVSCRTAPLHIHRRKSYLRECYHGSVRFEDEDCIIQRSQAGSCLCVSKQRHRFKHGIKSDKSCCTAINPMFVRFHIGWNIEAVDKIIVQSGAKNPVQETVISRSISCPSVALFERTSATALTGKFF